MIFNRLVPSFVFVGTKENRRILKLESYFHDKKTYMFNYILSKVGGRNFDALNASAMPYSGSVAERLDRGGPQLKSRPGR